VVLNHLEGLSSKYEDEQYPFQIVEAGGGYQFLTKADYHQTISHFLNLKSRRRLSTAAMETLAIIAYRQPVTKTEIENIRGVNCDYSIQKLLEKELIAIQGRAETPGKPLLYGTSETFMDYFGINSVDDLPKLREFEASGDVLGTHPELAGLELPTPQEGALDGTQEASEDLAEAEAGEESADSAEEASAEDTTAEESAEDVDSVEGSEEADSEVDEDVASEDMDAASTEEAEGEPEKA
jgi:segregation and condensation protein B